MVESHPHRETFKLNVHLLECENTLKIATPLEASGRWLFKEVCRKQNIVDESEYFGLQYVLHETSSTITKHWLDMKKCVKIQLKGVKPLVLSFRIKHYPPEPFNDFKHAKPRFLLYHQIRRDLKSGRLIGSSQDLVKLAALITQVELGDCAALELLFQPSAKEKPSMTYLSNFRVFHNQSQKIESAIIDEHRKLLLLPCLAAEETIRFAAQLDSYGLEPYKVKCHGSRQLFIGLTHEGIAEFLGNKRTRLFPWNGIEKIAYDGAHIYITIDEVTQKKYKHNKNRVIDFKCESKSVAARLWVCALEKKMFFTLIRSTTAKPVKMKHGLFSRKRTFTFSGRCHHEITQRALPSTMPNYGRKTKQPLEHGDAELEISDGLKPAIKSSSAMFISTDESTPFLQRSASQYGCTLKPFNSNDVSSEMLLQNPDVNDTFDDKFDAVRSEFFLFFESNPNRKLTEISQSKHNILVTRLKCAIKGKLSELDPNAENSSLDTSFEIAISDFGCKVEEAEYVSQSSILLTAEEVSVPRDNRESKVAIESEPGYSTTEVPEGLADGVAEEQERRSEWSITAISGGLILGISCLGLILALEAYSSPFGTVRNSPLLLEWESRYYKPFRTILRRYFQH